MKIVAKVGEALQRLFGEVATNAAEQSQVIQRTRKFNPMSMAKTFILGFLQNPEASVEDLAQVAAQCGAAVTPQAVDQRHTQRLVNFLEGMFSGATQFVVGAKQSLAPILDRFTSVFAIDSSTIALPDDMQDQYRGCGGSHGGGAAAMKLQTELDLRTGDLSCVKIEEGRSPDGKSSRQHVRRGPGSLRISDLGYFSLAVFAAMMAADEYFLSRLYFGTHVWHEGLRVDVLPWLAKQTGPFVDVSVLLGAEEQLPCRLIAWRLPPEQANRRRQKLRKEMKSKNGREPTAERLAWCDWTILVTNVPPEMLTPPEAAVLYRARWQIELLFKRWKSLGLIAQLSGSTTTRQMVRLWARLTAVVIQHWLTVSTICGDATRSLHKVYKAVRKFVGRLVKALDNAEQLETLLDDMRQTVAKTCRRNKRSKPGTYEMLNDISLLDFRLT